MIEDSGQATPFQMTANTLADLHNEPGQFGGCRRFYLNKTVTTTALFDVFAVEKQIEIVGVAHAVIFFVRDSIAPRWRSYANTAIFDDA